MDEKKEDKSEESKKKHIVYYKSLTNVINNIQKEIQEEKDPQVIKHLNDRIKAINLDKERIKKMFPDIDQKNSD